MDSVQKVRTYLETFNAGDRILEFSVSSATVELASQAIGCQTGRIAKTLSFMAGDQPVFIVCCGDARIDNRKYKERFGTKARMMNAEELAHWTGLQFGGVCPFAIPDKVHVYLDMSLRQYDMVYPAAGNAHSAVRVTPDELFTFSCARGWVDVCTIA